jgi:hypothetical protein
MIWSPELSKQAGPTCYLTIGRDVPAPCAGHQCAAWRPLWNAGDTSVVGTQPNMQRLTFMASVGECGMKSSSESEEGSAAMRELHKRMPGLLKVGAIRLEPFHRRQTMLTGRPAPETSPI